MEGPEIQFAEAVIDNGRFGTRTVRFETGRLAQQAQGAAVAYINTSLVTVFGGWPCGVRRAGADRRWDVWVISSCCRC